MDVNPKSHPDCKYSTNPYHECAYDCFDKIAQHQAKKHSKYQASNILSLTKSFGKTKTESHSPKVHHSGPLQVAVKKKMNRKANKSFSALSSDEISIDLNDQHDDSLNQKAEKTSEMLPVSPTSMADRRKNETASEISDFNVVSPPRSYANDDDDDGDVNNDDENGVGLDLESVMSDSSNSVGKYNVRSSFYIIIRSIIDKHGDIAANCKLESALMRARYLECLCSLIQELGSTPVGKLTKLEVKEMLALLMYLESVNIDVGWLRSVLQEFVQYKESADSEKERLKESVRSKKQELEIQKEDFARIEKEVTEARLRIEEMKAELTKLEWLLMEEKGFKVETFKGKSFLDELL